MDKSGILDILSPSKIFNWWLGVIIVKHPKKDPASAAEGEMEVVEMEEEVTNSARRFNDAVDLNEDLHLSEDSLDQAPDDPEEVGVEESRGCNDVNRNEELTDEVVEVVVEGLVSNSSRRSNNVCRASFVKVSKIDCVSAAGEGEVDIVDMEEEVTNRSNNEEEHGDVNSNNDDLDEEAADDPDEAEENQSGMNNEEEFHDDDVTEEFDETETKGPAQESDHHGEVQNRCSQCGKSQQSR